jgi:hypothetical protein
MEEAKKQERRYVGLDLGKREFTSAFLDAGGRYRMGKGKTSAEGRQRLIEQLRPGDKVALEAGNVAFIFAREIIERAKCEVVVLNSGKLPLIWDTPTKTDKEDARKLARVIEERRNDQLPLVPIPDAKELERRKVVASYKRAVAGRTKGINTLHAMFVQRGITTLKKKDLATGEKRAEAVKVLEGVEREEADLLLELLKICEKRIGELKGRMAAEVKADETMQRAESMIGVGPGKSIRICGACRRREPVQQRESGGELSGVRAEA